MEITKIVPGCYHLETDGNTAVLGCPPEAIKMIVRAGKSQPSVGILPDVSYANGVSQIALEFPAYWFMFLEQKGRLEHRFRVIGTPDMCARQREILHVTLLGPTRAQMKKWKISKSRAAMLAKMMDHMALKNPDGRILGIDDMFEFVPFPTDEAEGVDLYGDGQTRLFRLGENQYRVEKGENNWRIDLNFVGQQLPLLADPVDESEMPQVLRVKLLGSYSGFDAAGPTTGIVLWVNCNGFLVDGPVGTSSYLRRLGIPKSDLQGVILSHVHDDHCTLMDMILSETVANIITTREIYESMLIKVAGVLGESIDMIRSYLNFTEVVPGKTMSMYGAKWDFFYTVHSIPTIGFKVTVQGPNGKEHAVVHSSDTIHFEGLDTMVEAGAIAPTHALRMKNLVSGDERLVMLDGGGPPIHGRHEDYVEMVRSNPDVDFLLGHVNPDNVTGWSREVASPGWSRTYLPARNLSQSLILKLLKTLKLLEVSDPAWINILLSQGELLEIPAGEEVVAQGRAGDDFFFVLGGSQEVLDTSEEPPALLALLEAGDFFGEMSIIRGASRNATVRTHSSTVLYRLPGALFLEFVEATGLKERFERIWLSRSIISQVKIFRNLHPHAKNEIGLMARPTIFEKGDYVIRQGGKADDFFIITDGEAHVVYKDRKGKEMLRAPLGRGEFFGENVAMGYRSVRNASVVVVSDRLETLKISGLDLRRLARGAPIMCHELHLVMKERGLKDIPVNLRESINPPAI